MKNTFLKLSVTLIFLCIAIFVPAQNTQPVEAHTKTKFPQASDFEKSTFTYKVINAANKTYGYDIIADGKLLIHQPSIPGLPGNEGFKTIQSSEKVAQLVISKIKRGEMPPTVTREEMKTLKAID